MDKPRQMRAVNKNEDWNPEIVGKVARLATCSREEVNGLWLRCVSVRGRIAIFEEVFESKA